jgi:hypothetical protein
MVVAAAWRTSAGHVKGGGEHTAELLADAPASTAVEQRATLIISKRLLPLICTLSCTIPGSAVHAGALLTHPSGAGRRPLCRAGAPCTLYLGPSARCEPPRR